MNTGTFNLNECKGRSCVFNNKKEKLVGGKSYEFQVTGMLLLFIFLKQCYVIAMQTHAIIQYTKNHCMDLLL
jgi:hypothetical protein